SWRRLIDGIATSVTNATPPIQKRIATMCTTRAMMPSIACASGGQELVGGAEELIMDAVRRDAGERQRRYRRAQEGARTADIIIGFPHGRVGDQPCVGDDAGVVVIDARAFAGQRRLVEV